MGARGGRRRAECGGRDAARAPDAGPRARPPVLRAAPGERAIHRRPRARARLHRMCSVLCSAPHTVLLLAAAAAALSTCAYSTDTSTKYYEITGSVIPRALSPSSDSFELRYYVSLRVLFSTFTSSLLLPSSPSLHISW